MRTVFLLMLIWIVSLVIYESGKNPIWYKISCDTDKFEYHWITHKQLKENPFTCKDTNISVSIETEYQTLEKLNKINE